ncbi:methyltransferase [Mycolicibacterium hippocampi]|uniref:methyltransferase n=1 Tax=Mycolicibacterium hippocampi TaxID=659824 RepID=UPI003518E734
MPIPPKGPPPRLVKAVDRVRAGLQALHRSSAPGNIALLELASGAWTTASLYTAAKLGIPDRLATGPAHAEDVAARIGADPDAVQRLMRALAGRGVFKRRRDGRFVNTAIGNALRSDSEGSLRDMVLFIGHPARWEDWGNLLHSVQTGEPAVHKVRGMSFFDYLNTDPEFAQVFNNAMTAVSGLANEPTLREYDFTGFRLIVDVGGGHGALLATILRSAPESRGILYDLPAVVEGAAPTLQVAGVAHRVSTAGGSFMSSVPDGGDAYVLKSVIHDWDDETALTILRNVRTAIPPTGKLLLFEMVLPDRPTQSLAFMLDLEMLVTSGGRERTQREYAKLLAQAGFRLDRVVRTATPTSIVEASPV